MDTKQSKMPGFTAEASLYEKSEHYHGTLNQIRIFQGGGVEPAQSGACTMCCLTGDLNSCWNCCRRPTCPC